MESSNKTESADQVIGTITNKENPDQAVNIIYLGRENAFCTSGIKALLGMKEILIPVHLVATDFQLIGAILSVILERISLARETDTSFAYAHRFEILERAYTLTEAGEFMKLEWE